MSKFNKDMYAKIKAKKNKPLSSIGQKTLRITDKERERERKKWLKGVRPLLLWTRDGQLLLPFPLRKSLPRRSRRSGTRARRRWAPTFGPMLRPL